jgi:hypothetical protein
MGLPPSDKIPVTFPCSAERVTDLARYSARTIMLPIHYRLTRSERRERWDYRGHWLVRLIN